MPNSAFWAPYSNHPPLLRVVKTEGVTITLSTGQKLLDGIASWWSACHGYNHPALIQALKTQAELMPHVMFAGLEHQPALDVSDELLKLLPLELSKIFFSDSGSVAVEVALKIASGYYLNIGLPQKNKFISFFGGYHGDTLGCMNVSDGSSFAASNYRFKIPQSAIEIERFAEQVWAIKNNVAAIIIEPILQAAGGMLLHPPEILISLSQIAKNSGILLIFDEIATGFGRLGTMFACEQAGVYPDLMTIGKGFTGGTCTLAATIASQEIFNSFVSSNNILMHGPTFMANPLACAAACASLELFACEPRLAQVSAIERQLCTELKLIKNPKILDIRVKGAMGAIEIKDCTPELIYDLRKKSVELGAWLRPFKNVIYLMPAFTITEEELSKIISVIKKLVNEI